VPNPVILSPDCRAGKCTRGTPDDALDTATGRIVACGCRCHWPPVDFIVMADYLDARLTETEAEAVQLGKDVGRWHTERIANFERARAAGSEYRACGCQGCLTVTGPADEGSPLHPDTSLARAHSERAVVRICRYQLDGTNGPHAAILASRVLGDLAQTWKHRPDFRPEWRI
jgi:hypothetical protein